MARLALIAALAVLLPATVNAAGIAVDVDRATVLVADAPDAVRRPASIVKLMTAYVAFAALERGDVDEEDVVIVSRAAARQPPVKLRLRAGQDVRFGELLAAMAIGSKNDAAVAVAEAVAGSEAAFVALMNAAASDLGMVNTRYANASGLPAPGQRTTARDTALLALTLLTDYPERSLIFAERRTRAAGRGVTTTNPLFGRIAGAQGMKTGFTCAAGYNIVGLVEREGRRVLAVTLGHPGKAARLKAVRALLEAGFEALDTGKPLEPGAPSDAAPPDVGGCAARSVARAAPEPEPPEPEPNDTYVPPAPPVRQALALPRPSPPPVPPAPPPPPPLSGWAAFLGAFATDAEARATMGVVTARASGARTLPRRTFPRARDGRRLAVIHSLTRAQAGALCAIAKRAGRYCITLNPAALLNPKARWRR